MVLDTLKLSKDLQPAFTKEQAETLACALATVAVSRDNATTCGLALRKTDLSRDIAPFKAETIWWIVAAVAFNLVATAELIMLLVEIYGH